MQTPTRAACFASLFFSLALWTAPATAIDLTPLWDFSRPEVSELRFKAALENATGDDALILRTQIARTYGLRKDFDTARQLLLEIATTTQAAGPEAKVRYHLELGRTYASAAHPNDRLSEEAKAQARQSYGRALELARTARLDDLAIDAIHMFAFVDTAPADQLKWGQAALARIFHQHQVGGLVPKRVFIGS